MADKSRERNSAGLCSDYGLDERQKAVSREIGLKSFKLIFTVTALISIAWFMVGIFFPGIEISCAYTALSYWAATVACQCYYGIKASKYGVINSIAVFSFQTVSLFIALFMTVFALWFGVVVRFAGIEMENTPLLAAISAIAAINHYVMYFCGKRNDKVLEEQAKENEEEEQ